MKCDELNKAANMTIRQFAAIMLRVPVTGEPWLDEMIVSSRNLGGGPVENHTLNIPLDYTS